MIRTIFKRRILMCVCPIVVVVVAVSMLCNQHYNTDNEELALFESYVEAYRKIAEPILELEQSYNNGELTVQEVYDRLVAFGQDSENITQYDIVNSCWDEWTGYMDEHGIEYQLHNKGNLLVGKYLRFDDAVAEMQRYFPKMTYEECIILALELNLPDSYLDSLLENLDEGKSVSGV